MGVNGALRRVLTRSVLACGCAPLRLAHPPLTPTTREIGPTPSHPPRYCRMGFARKLPVREWHGYHATPAQVADKAIGRVSVVGRRYVRACRRPFPVARGSNAMRWAVTARRSDGPAHAANNMGESLILLRAAYMMMAALH
ncbi:hypothetical protein FQZ97_709120 [compost metagenome]